MRGRRGCGRGPRLTLEAVLVSLLISAGLAGSPSAMASQTPERPGVGATNTCSWTVVPGVPTAGLSAVKVLSKDDAWALSPFPPLVLHWNGSNWLPTPTPVPVPRGYEGMRLEGLVALSSTNVWVDGSAYGFRIADLPLIEHWNGSSWARVTVPNRDPNGAELAAISASGPNDIWAVGRESTQSDPYVVHWDGASWRLSVPPLLAGRAVWTVAAASATNVWVTQNPGVIEHWDGTAWTVQFGPVDGVTFMRTAVTSAGGPWAVGRVQLGFRYEAYTARWTGSARMPEPTPASKFRRSDLAGVDPVSPTMAWAVGGHRFRARAWHPLIERWDGTEWRIVHGARFNGYLTDIDGVPGNRALWAVGMQIERRC